MDDFRKFATKHLGMNSMVLDDVIKSQGYLNPYILEERSVECDSVGCVFPTDDWTELFFWVHRLMIIQLIHSRRSFYIWTQ